MALICSSRTLVILDVDELMFAFAPRQLMTGLNTAEALSIPASRSFKGLNGGAMIKFSLVVLVMVFIIPVLILSQRSDLQQIGNALCGVCPLHEMLGKPREVNVH